MKAIVTGGAGFIGSSLVKTLITDFKYEVLVLDSLTYASQLDSLNEVADSKLYSFLKVDISDQNTLETVIPEFQPNYIFNLAAETHVDRSIDSPDTFIKTNIIGTYSLLEASLLYWRSLDLNQKGEFRFLHVSTDEVYGDLDLTDPPFDELKSYEPSSPYSASKASSDHLVMAWYRTFDLPVLLTNCSNNYGPSQFYEKLIPLMILKAIRGEKLPIYGNGLQIRDWLFVEDHVNALVQIIQSGQIGECYNIGASCEKTNIEVVEEICQILDEKLDSKPKNLQSFKELISYVDDRPGHDNRYAINPNKLRNKIGWKPKQTFESGLRQTVDWYLERIESVDYKGSRIGKQK